MTWSPFEEDILKDPANGHAKLLEQCPVHRCDAFEPPFYTLSRFADVDAALRDIKTFSSHYGQGPRFSEPVGLLADPPQHTTYRQLMQPAFSPRAMQALRPQVEAVTHELLDSITEGPQAFDLHDAFAFPLPVIIIAQMLGVPTKDLEQFKRWSDIQVAAMGAPDPSQYADEQAAFFTYINRFLVARREEIQNQKAVPEDLLTLIAGARQASGDFIPIEDAQSMLQQLLVGGNETTTSLITNMVWRLLQNPALWQAVRRDPALVDAAIEESLRYDPPVLGLYRNTTCPVELHGETIPEGAKVLINYAAANRDPTAFKNPDAFDLHRNARKRHMSFGLGIHMCIGAPMARMEAEIALRSLVERLPDLHLLGDGERIAPFFLWGRKHLPVSR